MYFNVTHFEVGKTVSRMYIIIAGLQKVERRGGAGKTN